MWIVDKGVTWSSLTRWWPIRPNSYKQDEVMLPLTFVLSRIELIHDRLVLSLIFFLCCLQMLKEECREIKYNHHIELNRILLVLHWSYSIYQYYTREFNACVTSHSIYRYYTREFNLIYEPNIPSKAINYVKRNPILLNTHSKILQSNPCQLWSLISCTPQHLC